MLNYRKGYSLRTDGQTIVIEKLRFKEKADYKKVLYDISNRKIQTLDATIEKLKKRGSQAKILGR